MPPQIGNLISEAVYNNQLASNPLHPIADNILACHFIDIPGIEKPKGNSFMVCFIAGHNTTNLKILYRISLNVKQFSN
jgi:hypothetical protein